MYINTKNQILFTQLVFSLQAAAMQQMGKLKHPLTDKIERDLAAAQSTIDILDMISEKTKGNLTPDEDRFLSEVLRELKLNYVDEAGKPQESSSTEQTGEKNN
jgi:hypothetical protein